MIQVNELSFGYKKKQAPLFDSLNLDLQAGTICGILGKNGAGKTTLLRLIAGVLFPQHGMISVNGMISSERNVVLLADLWTTEQWEDLVPADVSGGRDAGPVDGPVQD